MRAPIDIQSDKPAAAASGSDDEQANEQADKLYALLGETAAGHKHSFELLYRECNVPLYGVLLRILKLEAIAQEALQETFIKIWRNAGQYNSAKSAPMVWMTRIAKNQAIDTLRYQGLRVDLELDDSNAVIELLQDTRQQEMSDSFDNTGPLLECLDRLQEQPRYCVVRAFCEGYSHEELSSLTHSPVGTVKSWIRRSLVALKRCLDEHD